MFAKGWVGNKSNIMSGARTEKKAIQFAGSKILIVIMWTIIVRLRITLRT